MKKGGLWTTQHFFRSDHRAREIIDVTGYDINGTKLFATVAFMNHMNTILTQFKVIQSFSGWVKRDQESSRTNNTKNDISHDRDHHKSGRHPVY
jgi:hypothetical protein